jgi:hypothetical protein
MSSKIKKISVPVVLVFYLFVFLFANILHNHPFTWQETDTCPAYIISTTQNSDTFPLNINDSLNSLDENIFNFQSYNSYLSFEIKNNFLSRAPPSLF